MIWPKLNKYRGFTLIELLVVISIIGLLSAVVLASLSDARAKAQDAAKNKEVHEIITALEMYFQENEHYPIPNDLSRAKCLGFKDGVACRGYNTGEQSLNTKIQEFLPALAPNTSQVPGGYNGITYSCMDTECSKYQLIWYLANPKGKCIGNAVIGATNPIECIYPDPNNDL